MRLYAGLEAINFQNKSKLAAGLIAIFDEVAALKKSLSDKSVQVQAKTIKEHLNKNTTQQLRKLIKSTTGINLSEVTYSKGMNFGYAMLPQIGDKLGLNAAIFTENYSGTGGQEYWKYLLDHYDCRCVTVDELQKLVESLNKETGIYRKDSLYDGTKVFMKLYFDPWSAFFIQEIGHVKCRPFTSEELAAICIHEIGHMHACLEHCLDMCYRSQLLEQAVAYFVKHASNDEKMKFAQHCAFAMNNTAAANAIDAIRQGAKRGNFGDFVLGSITGLVNALHLISLIYYPFMLMGRVIVSHFSNSWMKGLSTSLDKTSDYRTTIDNLRLNERLADQFVVRHGLGHAQISGLDKFSYNINHLMYKGFSTKSSIAWYSAVIPMMVYGLLEGQTIYLNDEHDPNTLRFEKMLQDTLVVFKGNLDPDMRDFYLAEYEKAYAAYKAAKGDRYDEVGECVYRILGYIASTPAALIGTGRFEEEYRRLMNMVNNLINNKLYYRAYKLESIIKE